MLDVLTAVELDLNFGQVLIMGKAYLQEGLAMGSGLAAGAATLFAAWIADRFLRALTLAEQAMFKRFFLILRWMDDRWVLARRGLTAGMKRILRRILSKTFYGEELPLGRDQQNNPFGFRSIAREGKVYVKQDEKLGTDDDGGWANFPMRQMVGPQQFETKAMTKGTLKGYIYRALDMTNESEEVLVNQVCRITTEMLPCGYDEQTILEILCATNEKAWVDTRRAFEVFGLSKEERRSWAKAHDEVEKNRNLTGQASNLSSQAMEMGTV